jgi:hypothetical protein
VQRQNESINATTGTVILQKQKVMLFAVVAHTRTFKVHSEHTSLCVSPLYAYVFLPQTIVLVNNTQRFQSKLEPSAQLVSKSLRPHPSAIPNRHNTTLRLGSGHLSLSLTPFTGVTHVIARHIPQRSTAVPLQKKSQHK